MKNVTTKCPVEEICEIAATDEGADSEPARKQIPNLTNPTTKYTRGTNFPSQRGKSAIKPLYVGGDDADIADINATDVFRLATDN